MRFLPDQLDREPGERQQVPEQVEDIDGFAQGPGEQHPCFFKQVRFRDERCPQHHDRNDDEEREGNSVDELHSQDFRKRHVASTLD